MAELLLVSLLLPFALAWLLTFLWIRLAPRLGLVDRPSPRKPHARPTPTGGGVALVGALVVGVLSLLTLAPSEQSDTVWRMATAWSPALALASIGFVDDLRPLHWAPRLAIHFLAAAAGVALMLPELDWMAFGAAVLFVAAMINAFNMLDNMDALCGGTALIAAGWFAVLGLVRGEMGETGLGLVVLGALAGFLWHNLPPAQVFLGDVGSTILGYILSLWSLQIAAAIPTPAWSWIAPFALLAVPLYDMTTVVLLRLSQGRNPFHADTQHFSHRLVRRGLTRPAAVGVILLLALTSGADALLLYTAQSGIGAAALALGLAAGWAALAVFEFCTSSEAAS
ncbi:MAG: undecaprenyl/decaprenyl-phosphate alpha-N-acetylglucosaminyl 1-phosphate transferase [Gemmataceae bacterium]|nr:undecaprenyl/decaprenyl-phosphate alpha-N-acetylglucosaminyl 1-phosphate transferase [Gemmataceae bacterium]MCI0741492.1 undecaprenyl/decaprenyl-phosphate alpha-N-acetylglucosaminyl 1-phosphate transferase [Gemmataceae bacterium]